MPVVNQLRLLKNAVADARNHSCIILGDFNLNEEMKFRHDYSHKAYYDELITAFDPLDLVQLVNFETWKRLVHGVWRTSTLDHIYTNDVTRISEIKPVEIIYTQHKCDRRERDGQKCHKMYVTSFMDYPVCISETEQGGSTKGYATTKTERK